MDRDQIAQTVALIVVLAAVGRWLPLGDALPAWIGADDRSQAWQIDGLAASAAGQGPDGSSDPVRAMLRAGNPKRAPAFTRWLAFARQIVETTPEDAVVQLKGISRNEGWIFAYDVYREDEAGDTHLCHADIKLACIDLAQKRPRAFPEEFEAPLRATM